MEIIGNIKEIKETVQVTDTFSKREFVVTTNDMYPQDILIQMTQDKCSLLDNYKVGQDVTVSINLRGREWTSPQGEVKYFNTIEGWRIEEGVKAEAPQQGGAEEDDKDLLPF